MCGGDGTQLADQVIVGLVPADPLKTALAPGPHAALRIEQAIRRVHDLGRARAAGTDDASRMVLARAHTLQLPLPEQHLYPATRITHTAESGNHIHGASLLWVLCQPNVFRHHAS